MAELTDSLVEVVLTDLSTFDPLTSHANLPERRIELNAHNNWTVEVGRATSTGAFPYQAADNARFGSKVMSRDHAIISAKPPSRKLYLQDVGSMHGTHLHGRRLQADEEVVMEDGDEIVFGSTIDRGDSESRSSLAINICLHLPVKYEPTSVQVKRTWQSTPHITHHARANVQVNGIVRGPSIGNAQPGVEYSDHDLEDQDLFSSDSEVQAELQSSIKVQTEPRSSPLLNTDPPRRFTVPESDVSDDADSDFDEDALMDAIDDESPSSSPMMVEDTTVQKLAIEIPKASSNFNSPTAPAKVSVASLLDDSVRPFEPEPELYGDQGPTDSEFSAHEDEFSEEEYSDEEEEEEPEYYDNTARALRDHASDEESGNEDDGEDEAFGDGGASAANVTYTEPATNNYQRHPSPSDAALARSARPASFPQPTFPVSSYQSYLQVPSIQQPPPVNWNPFTAPPPSPPQPYPVYFPPGMAYQHVYGYGRQPYAPQILGSFHHSKRSESPESDLDEPEAPFVRAPSVEIGTRKSLKRKAPDSDESVVSPQNAQPISQDETPLAVANRQEAAEFAQFLGLMPSPPTADGVAESIEESARKKQKVDRDDTGGRVTGHIKTIAKYTVTATAGAVAAVLCLAHLPADFFGV